MRRGPEDKVREAITQLLEDGELVSDAVIVLSLLNGEGTTTKLIYTTMPDWMVNGLLCEGMRLMIDEDDAV